MHPRRRPGPEWLANAVIYQIYPQSFRDSNGDGIGDIPGIIEKLDYIRSLGCDVIWITPCFDSPFGDGGYDVRDYYKLAPRYGTNEDLKCLFDEAHRRGIRVILDLVAGHTSWEHPWFRMSASEKTNQYTNWYIWTDNIWKGPGEGLEGIRGFSPRDGQYVTNYFFFQPALNYGFAKPDPEQPWQLPVDHPAAQAVREELVNILRYWLNFGADGFRVDMAFSLIKNDPGLTETMKLWQQVRAVLDREFPNAALLSEWSVPDQAIPAGFHVDFMIHFGTPAYTSLFRREAERDVFSTTGRGDPSYFDKAGKGNIHDFLDIYLAQRKRTDALGYISIPSGNHDITRLAMGRSEAELKLVFAFLLTLPTVPCIYYGDEIGMRHVKTAAFKEGGYGRCGARTPMQWSAEPNAGFSSASPEQHYLQIDPDPSRPDAESQLKDPNSLLNFIRKLLKLRKAVPALGVNGEFLPVSAGGESYPFVYLRKAEGTAYLIVINPGQAPRDIHCELEWGDSEPQLIFGGGVALEPEGAGASIHADGISFGIFEYATVAPAPRRRKELSATK